MAKTNEDIRLRLSQEAPSAELAHLLTEELEKTIEFFNSGEDSQFKRRILYRNAFSHIEGILHFMKLSTFSHYVRVVKPIVFHWKDYGIEFPQTRFFRLLDEDVLLSLVEKKVQIDDSGNWKLKEDWISTPVNIRFTFRIVAHVYGLDSIAHHFENGGWQSLKRCVTTRNRVTHPKLLDEFEVSDDEITEINLAIEWFQSVVAELLNAASAATEWDPSRVRELVLSVPEGERLRIVERMIEDFGFTEQDLCAD